jgi:hypothetical protein
MRRIKPHFKRQNKRNPHPFLDVVGDRVGLLDGDFVGARAGGVIGGFDGARVGLLGGNVDGAWVG